MSVSLFEKASLTLNLGEQCYGASCSLEAQRFSFAPPQMTAACTGQGAGHAIRGSRLPYPQPAGKHDPARVQQR